MIAAPQTRDFTWAVAQMKNGQKLRFEGMFKKSYYYIAGETLMLYSSSQNENINSDDNWAKYILCPNIVWKIFEEDTWDFEDASKKYGTSINQDIKTLKEKILADAEIFKCAAIIQDENYWTSVIKFSDLDKILDKRFGFK